MSETRPTETSTRGANGPMQGIRIVDFSTALTGPYAAALLADQGATVVKVERPGIGDIARWVGVAVNGISALYQAYNRGKRSISISLDTPQGVAIAKQLVREADVVVENFRPGVMDRLGLGWADLSEGRDDLVYASLSGFGSQGPYAKKGAYDTVIQAYGGIASNQADGADGEPAFLHQTVADKVTAMYAVQAITAALFARERGLGGQHVELSMLDSVVSFLWADAAGNEMMLDSDRSMPSSFVSTVRAYRFIGGWGVCTPTSDADFAGMCQALKVDGWDDPRVAKIADRRNARELMADIMHRCHESATTMTIAEARERMEQFNVPFGEVVSPAGLSDDPHAAAIGLLEDSVHPAAGRLRQPRHPAQFLGTPAALGDSAPTLGQHTDEILAELGYAAEDIAALRSGAIVT
ncbi:MAG: formyl-CoA transferase [Ilumatobacteraceae bacterium]|nr:formyl-CoA transferase [Ilumatobacteraceae bacterium]